jgi:CRISPR-associated protein Cmx8
MSAQAAPETDSLLLDYDLLSLPTAQHKAGLAGLLLHLRSLEQRKIDGAPVVETCNPFGASIRFTRDSMQRLFDDLYAAHWERVRVRSKYSNKAPLDEETEEVERDGKRQTIKWYIYEDVRPTGTVLTHWLQQGKADPWLRLWQNMLWSVLRAQPATRGEFNNTADGQSVGLVDKLWLALNKAQKQAAKGKLQTESIAGSLFVGAQDRNAERVTFVGRVEHNLLLHFWQWAAPIFVPRAIDPRSGNWEYQGFLLVIPEVADLQAFVDQMESYWLQLDPTVTGYRPTESLVDLPEEGGLEFLHQLVKDRLDRADLLQSVHAVELYHQEKQGNNVRQHAARRLIPTANLLSEYNQVRGDRRKHPLFKRLQIGNLVEGRPWFHGAQDLFDRYAAEIFIQGPGSPRGRFFGTDVRQRFKETIQTLEGRQQPMQSDPNDEALQRLLYRLVRHYVEKRTRDRAGIDDNKDYASFTDGDKRSYREAKPKVATTAFLALRGRREQDIAEYVIGTLCAFGFHQKEEDFMLLANRLIDKPETVKNLAMLALSAHSWTRRDDDDKAGQAAADNH